MTWRPGVEVGAAKALDIHLFSSAIRRLMFAPAITEFLGLIFENKALASQTLGFLRGSAQDSHQDSAYVTYTLPRKFAASWIALEDVTVGAGELFYYPGSHRLPDFLYAGRYKSMSEARRMGWDRDEVNNDGHRHVQSLDGLAQQFGITRQVFAAKQGDVLIWHSDLIHGGHKVSQDTTRKSIVTHYCPKHVAPLFGEAHAVTFRDHDGHLYTSNAYPGLPPLETSTNS
jgi:ectoine hydroxylase-related dioxygenase (phytanoyl-CoA dioxygenase family)